MKNKKGDVAIVILVILVLLLCVSSWFVFSLSKSNKINTLDLTTIEKIKSNQFAFEESLSLAGERALIKTFDEFVSGNQYDYLKNRKNTGEFFALHDKLNENFALRFKENFLEYFSSQNFYANSLLVQYKSIQNGNFDVSFDGNEVVIKLDYSPLSVESDSILVDYSAPIKIKIPLNQTGLNGFNEIYLAKENCKSFKADEMKNCFDEKLYNFDAEVYLVLDSGDEFGLVSVDSTSNLNFVHLVSKDSFSFENGIRNVNITFVPR